MSNAATDELNRIISEARRKAIGVLGSLQGVPGTYGVGSPLLKALQAVDVSLKGIKQVGKGKRRGEIIGSLAETLVERLGIMKIRADAAEFWLDEMEREKVRVGDG